MYNCHSTRGDRGYWRCHNYSKKKQEQRCRARCVVKNGQISAITGGEHNHLPHKEKIEKIVRRNSLVQPTGVNTDKRTTKSNKTAKCRTRTITSNSDVNEYRQIDAIIKSESYDFSANVQDDY